MRKLVLAVSFGIFFLQVFSVARAEEVYRLRTRDKAPNEELVRRVKEAAEGASSITIKFRPEERMGRVPYSKENIDKGWQYLFHRRCAYRCNGVLPGLHARLQSGRRIEGEGECPGGYSIVVEFLDDRDKPLLRAYLTLNGHCMTIGENSYYLPITEPLGNVLRNGLKPLEESEEVATTP